MYKTAIFQLFLLLLSVIVGQSLPDVDSITEENFACFGNVTQGNQSLRQIFNQTCRGVDFEELGRSNVSKVLLDVLNAYSHLCTQFVTLCNNEGCLDLVANGFTVCGRSDVATDTRNCTYIYNNNVHTYVRT